MVFLTPARATRRSPFEGLKAKRLRRIRALLRIGCEIRAGYMFHRNTLP